VPTLAAIQELQVKSEIARPCLHEVVSAGRPYRVFGAAWAGESEVTKVEVSYDNGKNWQPAKLLEKAVPFAWRMWEYQWQVPKQHGTYTLMAKATDQQGRVQPASHDPDRRAYQINRTLPVSITVR
jgi:hypothetical protein